MFSSVDLQSCYGTFFRLATSYLCAQRRTRFTKGSRRGGKEGGRGRGGMLVFHMVTPWILKPAFSRFSYTNRVKQILQIKSGLLELRKTIVPSLRFTMTVFLYLSIYLSFFLSFFSRRKTFLKST